MTKGQFLLMAVVCAFETYFFNDAIFSQDYLIAVFWGILLLRNLQRAYLITQFTKNVFDTTKRKD
ncbi:DUF3272 family protein [Streptococcus pantholopis]|uniref:DUF3272 domain-containing protein n=1 Tax=Streptococcus pantholopis TaxID=1811193 RepID=A0A172QAB8_9STRE|nr:DUF3272 family protein [Streptococcus pantholopis]AND80453.1 hypothetical protein A0O21_06170 [Streptococcus pantholopis]